MQVKGVIEEDFVNYKLPAMFINTSTCTFKCEKECGEKICQNSDLVHAPTIEVDNEWLVCRFIDNPISKAIVFGGLEPLDTLHDLACFVAMLNVYRVPNDLVIYTGYNEDEIMNSVKCIRLLCAEYRNLIIKYGRYIPNDSPVFDNNLGVTLASSNQYSKLYPRNEESL